MLRALLFMVLLHGSWASADRVIHREKSLYRNIIVSQKLNQRCLAFSVKRRLRHQTCIDSKDPDRLVFAYTRMAFAGLLVNPNPGRGLMIGMGGGVISRVLTDVYPALEMDLVEIDPAVVRVAGDYFDFKETPNTRIHVADGRVFTRRALLRGERYDLIILDAFTGDYIPEHLMTVEFLRDVKALLSPGGVVIANTFSGSTLYDHESVTYTRVFGRFLNLKMPGSGNRVIVATASNLPDTGALMTNARLLTPKFERYSVDLTTFVPRLSRESDWNTGKKPLTDQYAPANLLRGRQ